uniref:VDE domain-containing protein n=1 Tax=Macrostomum lignano TaxID=282301 RepID=A0A1I8GG02_9PLAT
SAAISFQQLKACPAESVAQSDGVNIESGSSLARRIACSADNDATSCQELRCTLSCKLKSKCTAALYRSGQCLMAGVEAFLSQWLPDSSCRTFVDTAAVRKFQLERTGDLSAGVRQSMKLLYNFRMGMFNLAQIPDGGNPHAPLARGVLHNKSMGIYLTGQADSLLDVVTAPDTDRLFIPASNVTVYIRGRFLPNFYYNPPMMHFFYFTMCNDTSTLGERFTINPKGKLFRLQLSMHVLKYNRYVKSANAFLNTSDFASFGYRTNSNDSTTLFYNGQQWNCPVGTAQLNAKRLNSPEHYSCLRFGGFRVPELSLMGWLQCFSLARGKLTAADIEEIETWCKNH